MGMVPDNRSKRNNICDEDCPAPDKCMLSDPAPLVHCDGAAKPNLLTDSYVTTNMRIIGDHAFVPQHTIVCGMRVGHE